MDSYSASSSAHKTFQTYLSALNEAQKKAVQAEGRVLVSAGAGTGKTRVLILHYAWLVYEKNAPLQKIMAVTFTNRAAQEMRGRLEQLMGIHTKSLWIGTFHSLALRILKDTPELIDRKAGFSVLDTKDQGRIMAKLLKAMRAKKNYTPQNVIHQISAWKCKTWLPEEVPTAAADPVCLTLYHQYQEELKLINSVDFDDLLLLSYHLLKDHESIRTKWQNTFQHILVDEYQDINELQYVWLKLLSAYCDGLFCVGDDDQSIYGWRGANIENILNFQKDFAGAKVIALEENYRSASPILSAASQLIAHNRSRYGKTLTTQRTGGEKIDIQGLWDPQEEAAYVVGKIRENYKISNSYASMAILMRTTAQSREFEERLVMEQIPYQVIGSINFYERQEIRDMLGYLRWIHNKSDGLAFERIINTPKRGVGPIALEKIYLRAHNDQSSLEDACRALCSQEKMPPPLALLLQNVENWRHHKGSIQLLAERVFKESGYEAYLIGQGHEGLARQENVKELIKALENFQNLEEFLDHVSLLLELRARSSQDSVSILTLHAAKGLEFDETFLVGWEEQLFPHVRCLSERDLEEERRLAYVALTRAKNRVRITFCWNRRTLQGHMPASPSRFIQELPSCHVNLCLSLERPRAHTAPTQKQYSWNRSTHVSAAKAPVTSIDTVSAAASSKALSIHPGTRLFHKIFGWGTVQSHHGGIVKLHFERHGSKSVMEKFLSRVEGN